MAVDEKLSQKPVASSTGSGDKYYIVQGGISKQIDWDNLIPYVTITADTSTIIDLSNVQGNLCNMASANATTTYTLTGTITAGNARVLINAASEPVITGATNITGSTFVISTNMYLVVWNNGNRSEFWFEEI